MITTNKENPTVVYIICSFRFCGGEFKKKTSSRLHKEVSSFRKNDVIVKRALQIQGCSVGHLQYNNTCITVNYY